MSGRGYISVEEDRKCSECGKMAECRPYGEDGADICFDCAMATPESRRRAESHFERIVIGRTKH